MRHKNSIRIEVKRIYLKYFKRFNLHYKQRFIIAENLINNLFQANFVKLNKGKLKCRL